MIVTGVSNKITLDEQGKFTGDAWERLPEPRPRLKLVVYSPSGKVSEYDLGPHSPRLRQADIDLVHDLWRQLSAQPELASLHHYHVIRLAVEDLNEKLRAGDRARIIARLKSGLLEKAES
jgi:hypothetical protein